MSVQSPEGGGQARPPTCYNCGADDHFMMACPEPTRQVPAGLAAARAAEALRPPQTSQGAASHQDTRPFKRQKTGPVVTRYPAPNSGPVITRYTPPVNQTTAYGPNSGQFLNQNPVHQQPFPQQGPYGPPHGYFPHQPGNYGPYNQPVPPQPQQPQPYVQRPPRYNFASANATPSYGQNVQQPYGFQRPQPSVGTYGPYHTTESQYSPASGLYNQAPLMNGSNQPYQQFVPQSQTHAAGWSQPHPASAYSGPSHQPNSTFQNRQHHKFQKSFHSKNQNNHGGPPLRQFPSQTPPVQPPNVPLVGSSSPNNVQALSSSTISQKSDINGGISGVHRRAQLSGENDKVDEFEDPDLEWDSTKIFIEIDRRPADPIAHPLPNVFSEDPILPPAYDATHLSCKYVRPGNVEVFSLPVIKSLHWATLRSDPVFKDIDVECGCISLDDLEMWIRNPYSKVENFDDNGNDRPPLISRKRARSQDASDEIVEPSKQESSPDSLPTATQPVILETESQVNEGGNSGTPEDPEFRGSRTPILDRQDTPMSDMGDNAWVPQPGEGQMTVGLEESRPRMLHESQKPVNLQKSNLRLSTSSGYSISQNDSTHDYNRRPHRQDSGYVSARGSYSTGSGSEYDASRGEHYWIEHPPPPPPPPPRRHSDVAIESPFSDDSARGSIKRQDEEASLAVGSSPLTPTSAELLGQPPFGTANRKRPEPQRQVDDVTPKLKRRQPRVDEVYSRRW